MHFCFWFDGSDDWGLAADVEISLEFLLMLSTRMPYSADRCDRLNGAGKGAKISSVFDNWVSRLGGVHSFSLSRS